MSQTKLETMTPEKIRRLATLARLHVEDAQIETTMRDMHNILQYIDKLTALENLDVQGAIHAVDEKHELRQDQIKPSFTTEQALHNAPERLGDGFGVPKIIE